MQIRGFLQFIDAIGDQIRGGGRSEGRNGGEAGAVGLSTEDEEKEEEEMQGSCGHGF